LDAPTSASAKDPYRSERDAYARPGLLSDGTNSDTPIQSKWLTLVASYGNYVTGVNSVGWPSGGPLSGSPNVVQTLSSFGTCGRRQYFGNGAGTYDNYLYVLGAIARFCNSQTAYWVPPPIWGRWRIKDQDDGYLGWPITAPQPLASWQGFQGGCIYVSGSTWVDKPWGQGQCAF
jgi:hypothetical protein